MVPGSQQTKIFLEKILNCNRKIQILPSLDSDEYLIRTKIPFDLLRLKIFDNIFKIPLTSIFTYWSFYLAATVYICIMFNDVKSVHHRVGVPQRVVYPTPK